MNEMKIFKFYFLDQKPVPMDCLKMISMIAAEKKLHFGFTAVQSLYTLIEYHSCLIFTGRQH
jgi:hypothetical protein